MHIQRNTILTLNHGHPRLGFVGNLCLTAQAHNLLIVNQTRNHPRQRIRENLGIRIDTQDGFVPIGTDARHTPNGVEKLVLERGHAFVKHDFLQKGHEHDLRVTFSSVSGLDVVDFERVTALGDEDDGYFLLLGQFDGVVVVFVVTGVDFGHVVTLVTVGDGDVRVRFDLFGGNNEILHHAQYDIRRSLL